MTPPSPARDASAPSPPAVHAHVMRLPLAFEPNVGQAPRHTRYLSRGPGLRVELRPDGAVLTASGGPGQPRTVRLGWIGGAATPAISADEQLPGRVHHYSTDPARTRRDVPTFRRVVYRGVYPGTDLVFHGTQGAAEFDFVVAPGADPRRIALEVRDADTLALEGGDIVIQAGEQTLRLHAPVLYQAAASGRTPVDGRFRVDGRRIAFDVGEYDRTRPLVIDPVVAYSTYLGRWSGGVGVDAAGNMYSAGAEGVFKLSASGSTLLYNVVLGDMTAQALRVDGAGNAYLATVCPYSRSGAVHDCPTSGSQLAAGRPASQGDIGMYVVKLGPTGAMLHSTSVGGVGTVEAGGLAVDGAGNVYVTGWNARGGFPTSRAPFARPGVTPGFPAFVEAIAADFSRFLYVVEFHLDGNLFVPRGIAVDRTGAVYIAGRAGAEFPTTPGALQPSMGPGLSSGAVAKIAPDGSRLVYATYFGNGSTEPNDVTVAADGNAYLVGSAGAGLPTVRALQPAPAGGTDAFVSRLDATGSALVFSTYLGGGGDDAAVAVALDGSTNMYVAGTTRSTDFPLRNALPAPFATAASNFVTAIAADGASLIYSTYFASAQTFLGSLVATANGTVYVSGSTSSTSYPTVRPYQAAPGPGILARIDPAQPRVFITSPAAGASVSGTVTSDVWMENAAAGSRTVTLSVGTVTLGSLTTTANHVTMGWDSRRVPNGARTLVATVTDAARATGSGRRAFNVQNAGGATTTPLTAAFTSPASGATVSGAVTVGMSQTGASGTPITFTLSVDTTQVFTATGTAPTASFVWNSGTVASGGHTLRLTVRDGAGRTATATRPVTVSNAPSSGGGLTVSITQPKAGATVGGTVWFTIWVSGSTGASKTYTLGDGTRTVTKTDVSSGPVSMAWGTTAADNGARRMTVTVREGTRSGSASVTVTVAN